MAFEGQDDFYIAKLLVEPGTEVAVGSPILISVEDKSIIAAFDKFVVPAAVAATPTPPKAVEPPVQKITPPSTPVAAPVPVAPTPVTLAPVPVASKSSPASSAVVNQSIEGTYSVRVNNNISKNQSPLILKLNKDKLDYNIKYGRAKEEKKEDKKDAKSDKAKSKA